MYSKKLLRKYIEQRLQLTGSNHRQLAQALGASQSNLTRALADDPTYNLTLPQFAGLIDALQLEPVEVFHILTGKKAKEAAATAVAKTCKHLVEQLLK